MVLFGLRRECVIKGNRRKKNDMKRVTIDTKIMWDIECCGGLQVEYLAKFGSLGKCQIVITEISF